MSKKSLSRKVANRRPDGASDIRLHKLFHQLVLEWQKHVKSEVALHRKFASGGRDLSRHIKDTVKLHEDFLLRVKRLSKKRK